MVVPTSFWLACVAAISTAAVAVPIDLANFRINFANGRSASGSRLRRDMSVGETSVRVQFTANETEFDLDLQLLPSVFTRNGTSRDFEPPAYSDEKAVFILGLNGQISGTVWSGHGTINIHREAGRALLVAEQHTWGEYTDAKCGVHTHTHTSNGSSTGRERRVYDQWWGNPNVGSCYPGDDVTRAAKMGIAVGYQMWVEVGETVAAVTEYITAVVQTTNIVVSIP